MYKLFLAHPAISCYFAFVFVFLLWGLCTRDEPGPAPAGSACPFTALLEESSPLLVDAIRPSAALASAPVPRSLRWLHASCAAEYRVKFRTACEKIRYHG